MSAVAGGGRRVDGATTTGLAYAQARSGDGDAVAVHAPWLDPLVRWHLGVRRPGPERPLQPPGVDAAGLVLGPGPWTGRVWLLEPTSYFASPAGGSECGAPWTGDDHLLRCLQFRVPAADTGPGAP